MSYSVIVLFLFVLCCFIVDVHRCRNVGVTHNLLNDFQVCLVLTETGAEGMSYMVATENAVTVPSLCSPGQFSIVTT